MSKKFERNKQRQQEAAAVQKKNLIIGIAIASVAVIVLIAAVIIMNLPKPSPVSELAIEDMVVGTGREAKNGDTVMVEYIGWVYGRARQDYFDQTAKHDKPFEFVIGKGQAIDGFDQGVVGMKVGGQRKLVIPPGLAYGNKGALKGKIPPNAALVFEVELIEVATTLPPTTIEELKVEDLVVGIGAAAKPGNTLTVHYTGWLEDGSKFDSSHDSGEPIEFVLGTGKVIAGWEQGLVGMRAGGKRKLTIPPDLAYGKKGAFNFVPPNAALIFDVELISIK